MLSFNQLTKCSLLVLSIIGSDPASAGASKIDLFGITTGMSYSQFGAAIGNSGWKCNNDGWSAICYRPDHTQVTVTGTANSAWTVKQVRVFLKTADTAEHVVASISEQYGQRAVRSGAEHKWQLSDGSTLSLWIGEFMTLDLFNQKIIDADEKVLAVRTLRSDTFSIAAAAGWLNAEVGKFADLSAAGR